jgi:hypothetical protein
MDSLINDATVIAILVGGWYAMRLGIRAFRHRPGRG